MNDLKLIKKHYGEDMMHLCRMLFPTLLENEGLLWKIISEKFAYSKVLHDDIVNNHMEEEFKDLIYREINVENNNELFVTKTPKELLEEVGYDLYECKTEEDIQTFRKYYYKSEEDKKHQHMTYYGVPSYTGEELCTFGGGRLERCHVFFAVKKNVDEIKREDFEKPERQDEYGTSVLSIQFTKDKSNTLSIKNRYNHTVNNPDSTFSNNLDNIIEGLTESFNKTYNLNTNNSINRNFELPNYIKASDGKFYKYNVEINNVYYCPNNIIIDNFKPYELDKAKYVVMENYILDLKRKKLYQSFNRLYKDNIEELYKELGPTFITNDDEYIESGLKDKPMDSFIESIEEINNVRIELNKDKKERDIIINDDIKIVLDKDNNIVEYHNKNQRRIYDEFLPYNKKMRKISLPSTEVINIGFLTNNVYLEDLDLPNVREIWHNFIPNNSNIRYLNLPSVEKIHDGLLRNCTSIQKVSMPSLKYMDNNCLTNSLGLQEIDMPNVRKIGNNCYTLDYDLEVVNLPFVEEIGAGTFKDVAQIREIHLPNVKKIGDECFSNTRYVKVIDLPEVEKIGDEFMRHNQDVEEINMPKVKRLGSRFLNRNNNLRKLIVPSIITYENELSYQLKDEPETDKTTIDTIKRLIQQSQTLEYVDIDKSILDNEFINNLSDDKIEILNKSKAK